MKDEVKARFLFHFVFCFILHPSALILEFAGVAQRAGGASFRN
jgi:hypothetical protein